MSSIFLKERIQQLGELYEELATSSASFQNTAPFGCKPGCGACCTRPNAVWAMVGEMLPMAWKIYEAGQLEKVCLELRDETVHPSLCSVYKISDAAQGLGQCMSYHERPMVCRLFGSTARRVRSDVVEMIACAWQRVEFAATIREVDGSAISPLTDIVPIANDWAWRVRALMQEESLSEEYPINQALSRALEIVDQATAYEAFDVAYVPPPHPSNALSVL